MVHDKRSDWLGEALWQAAASRRATTWSRNPGILCVATLPATGAARFGATRWSDAAGMWNGPNLFKMLEREWDREATGPPARAALSRWARSTDLLDGLHSPAEVVLRCQDRGDRLRSAEVLSAVLGHSGDGDPWAARTVLQAVLPGLAAVSRRARPLVGPSGVWQAVDELDQHVVATACERIATLAPAPPAWPATAIVDGTWQRVRTYAATECRRGGRRAELAEMGELVALRQSSAAQELAQALADAVERGILGPLDGWLVYASRAEGASMEDLAAELGRNARWAWRRRVQAERLLADSAHLLAGDAVAV